MWNFVSRRELKQHFLIGDTLIEKTNMQQEELKLTNNMKTGDIMCVQNTP